MLLLEACISNIARDRPLLLIMEDLHWADTNTLEWLDHLLSRPPSPHILFLLTGRPELFTRWRTYSAITQLALNRLNQNESNDLIQSFSEQTPLPDKFKCFILEKSAGNPLFIEEYTRMLMHQKSLHNDTLIALDSVPDSLEELVHAQLDYLGAGKIVAQTAAVIGRIFETQLLIKLLTALPENIDSHLENLADAGIMYRYSESHYIFKHALIRDALYSSIAADNQHKLHRRLANILVSQNPQTTSNSSEMIAFHYSSAKDSAAAIPWWIQSATQAQERHAVKETIRLCRRGLLDLKNGFASPQLNDLCLKQELDIQMILGPALIADSNYANNEVGAVYQRALELSTELNEADQRFISTRGLWSFHCVRAQHRNAFNLAQTLVHFSKKANDDNLRVEAHLARGVISLFMADLEQATADLDYAIGHYQESMTPVHIQRYGQDPAMAIYTFRALLEEAKGDGNSAIQYSVKAVEAGRRSNHPFSLGFALAFSVHVNLRQQNTALDMRLREEYKQLCTDQEIHVFKLLGAIQEGLILISSGNLQKGISAIEAAIPPYKAFGTEIFVASWLGCLAMAYLQNGNIKYARKSLEAATKQMQKSGEYLSQPLLETVEKQFKTINPGVK